ncbi:Metalloprotease, Hemolysin-type calcium-binding region [Cupriavidus taiwanensis]|uniref:Metalloprotease, Hemolysin-type calcium-binding region n=1 Tax=Cupriavidus taiwanensis TaxID=164546 RepID=A0A375E7P6_9BURK|nr:VCBS domain-containing protein [Cupriavidus taiwanensis]SOZ64904.1 Metalloprotease, Hemolysin-type calcium-binding region [Cupriavidus taiwanensis]SOZ65736.1 Metalloprotease, Hemolysin-type calcium-binding region [Cupriavidus taiwanensis]SOZ69512.1 Metalloprotease, Hemolysin-type calcium-binding region [Cupriavidus taiwanensis]SPA08563.1 Metalloprotease, Hemolysin-type calcium-binding region [Cupriavidus taiwanensis]
MATVTGTNGSDSLIGTATSDTILSGNGNDYVSAGDGSDYVDAGNGDDIVEGGDGNDTLLGANGKDRVFGGRGNDSLSGGNGTDAVYGGSGDDVIGSADGASTLYTGDNGGDTLYGDGYDSYADYLRGRGHESAQPGNDRIQGGNGDDLIFGDNGDGAVVGGDDIIAGGHGKDTVYGEGGNDTIAGGGGGDMLNGGSGRDTFVYHAVSDSTAAGMDVIAGFQRGTDRLDLRPVLGDTGFQWGGLTPTAHGAWYQQAGGNTYVYVDVDGNPATAEMVIRLDGLHDLTKSDFAGYDNHAPTAAADISAIGEDNHPNPVTGNVLANDSDVDAGNVLAVASPGTYVGQYGTLQINADGSYSYTLDNGNPLVQSLRLGDHVEESFGYSVTDGQASAASTLSIRINGANDVATISASTSEDTAVTEAGGVANATAGDVSAGGTLTVSDVDSGEAHFAAVAPESLVGQYGTFTFDSSTGAWTYTLDNGKADSLTAGQQGSDSLLVSSADQTAQQTITVNIAGTNDAATITASASEDMTVTEAGGVANATAGDASASGTLTVSDVDSGEAHFAAVAPESLVGEYGTFTFDSSTGAWTYTLANGKADSLTAGQQVSDSLLVSSADQTAQQTITVNITGTNDAAIITASASEDTAVTEAGGVANATAGDASASGTLTVNDVDSGEAHFAAVAPESLLGQYGTFTFDSSTGAWTYTLDNGKADSLTAGQQVSDSLTVHSADLSASQEIKVNIAGANDTVVNSVPVAQVVNEDTPLVFSTATGNALSIADVDGTSHTVTLTASAGTITLNGTAGLQFLAGDGSADGTMTFTGSDEAINAALDGLQFTGDKDYAGGASLQLQTSDGAGIDTDSVAIILNPVNDAPVAAGDVVYVSNNTSNILIPVSALLGNDGDLDGLALSITALGGASGAISNLRFAPDTNNSYILFDSGNAATGSFSYTVADGAGGTSTATVTVNVSSTNGAATVSLAGQSYQASYLDGGSNNDALTGAAAGDVFIGGAASDTLRGGAGDDVLRGAAGDDTLDGGGGIDMLDLSDASGGLTFALVQGGSTLVNLSSVGLGSDTYSNMEGVIGSRFNDSLAGSGANDVLRGGAGNDTLDGGAGIDLLDFSDATGAISFTLVQGSGVTAVNLGAVNLGTDSYTKMEGVIGSAFNDTISGSAGNDVLRGGAGDDVLAGAAGNDLLVGGAGADTLAGGDGSDIFRVLRSDAASVDTITDFNLVPAASGGDVLDLSDLLSGVGVSSDNAAQFVRLAEVDGNTVVSLDRDGTGTAAAFQDVAVLQGMVGLDLNTLLSNGNIHMV